MKKLTLIFILTWISIIGFAQNISQSDTTGTLITASIRPNSQADNIATIYTNEARGTTHHYQTWAELLAMKSSRLVENQLATVADSAGKLFQYRAGSWKPFIVEIDTAQIAFKNRENVFEKNQIIKTNMDGDGVFVDGSNSYSPQFGLFNNGVYKGGLGLSLNPGHYSKISELGDIVLRVLEGKSLRFAALNGANFIFSSAPLGSDIDVEKFRIANNGNLTALGTITSPNFISTITTGTQPYVTTSITKNTNLNADLWDGEHLSTTSGYLLHDNGTGTIVNAPIYAGQVSVSIGNKNLIGRLSIGDNGESYFGSNVLNTLNFMGETNAESNGWINYTGYIDGFTQFRDLFIGDGKGNKIATFKGSSKLVTLTGAAIATNFTSNISIGTQPYATTSTTLNTNLNADLLDGHHWSEVQPLITNPVTGTGTFDYLPIFTGTNSIGNSKLWMESDFFLHTPSIKSTHDIISLDTNANIGISSLKVNENSFVANVVDGLLKIDAYKYTSTWNLDMALNSKGGKVGIGVVPTAQMHVKGKLTQPLTGTVSITAGTNEVTGIGTAFDTELQVGDAFKIGESPYPQTFTVTNIAGPTSMTLSVNHTNGASGLKGYKDANLFQVDDGNGVNKMYLDKEGKAYFTETVAGANATLPNEFVTLGQISVGGTTTQTLQQVTDEGNTTTNAITVGDLSVNGRARIESSASVDLIGINAPLIASWQSEYMQMDAHGNIQHSDGGDYVDMYLNPLGGDIHVGASIFSDNESIADINSPKQLTTKEYVDAQIKEQNIKPAISSEYDVVVDFLVDEIYHVNINKLAVTFSAVNPSALKSRVISIFINGYAFKSSFTFPPEWAWLGTAPTDIVTDGKAILTLQNFGDQQSDIVASYVLVN